MTIFTAGQAAKAVGVSTPTITKACKSGRLSHRKKDGGGYEIEASELFRVFEPVKGKTIKSEPDLGAFTAENAVFTARLEAELEALQIRFDDQTRERDRDQQDLEDLRKDRDHWREQAQTQLRLTAQKKQPWWERLFGKSDAA